MIPPSSSENTTDVEDISLPFRPRARLLQLLGDQLIGSPRLAVFELVKNAYDADAENVVVTFKGLDTPNPLIVVEDDGSGMTLRTIVEIWLVPAHDHREKQRKMLKRTARNRLPLGEKGLGRFAVHKLGDEVELVTRALDEPECFVTINWDALIEEAFLSDAPVRIRTRTPEVFVGKTTGTRITVSRLRSSSWNRGEVRRLLRQITSISSPFSTRSDRFDATLCVPEHPEWVEGMPDIPALLARAPWRFSFRFESGDFQWKYEFRGVIGLDVEGRVKTQEHGTLQIAPDRDRDESDSRNAPRQGNSKRVTANADLLAGIGPISGEFYVYDRDRIVLSRIGDTQMVQGFLDEHGGIRVYRDGIRIYNYGEPGDDWLGLDLRRVNRPTRSISRNIVVGAIDLSLETSTALTEKTNREGFVENDAFRHLRQIVLGALAVLETERKIDKQNMRSVTEAKSSPAGGEPITVPLAELRRVARHHNLSTELDPLIDKVEHDYNSMRDTMLRAGLSGMSVAMVFHEIEQGVRTLQGAIEVGVNPETLLAQARELAHLLDGFSDLLRKGERQTTSLKYLIKRARDLTRIRFRNHNIRLRCPAIEDEAEDVRAPFAFGLVLAAITNLIDNAIYWLRVRWPDGDQGPPTRAIYINICKTLADGPAIIIADNGPGFQDGPDQLTQPFFSRRPDGMGIGLYYASMVMEINSGQLAFPVPDEAEVPAEFDGAVVALILAKEPS